MEETTPRRPPSKVPKHLRRFHHTSKSCSDFVAKAPYSYSFAPPKPADPVELCPPHWRLPEKQRLKTKLRAILLKDLQSLQSQSRTLRQRTPERPTMMRMKDSDDYITARAANPRTGLISPSVGSPTPHVSLTPESPADALRLRKAVQSSPTPDDKSRPALRQANEERKVSVGAMWRANGNGWMVDGTTAVASPRVTTAEAGAGLVSSSSQSLSDEDQFVVKMLSAREPQPYAFPGYSAQQIEAFEHYKQKARRVSGEGYDRRILQAARKPSGGLMGGNKMGRDAPGHLCSHPARAFTRDTAPLPNGDITVLKRRARTADQSNVEAETSCAGGAELRAANFAPFSSPKTPIQGYDRNTATSLTTFGSALHGAEKLTIHKPIARKPISKPAHPTDPRDLPQVSLAHPSVAALPRAQHEAVRHADASPRKCSFGCVKDSENGACVATGSGRPPQQRVSLFDGTPLVTEDYNGCTTVGDHTSLHALYWISDLFIGALVSLFELSKHIRLPRVRLAVLEVLRSEHAPPQQKVEAMKTVVYSTGQALGLITAVVMVWNLGSVMIRLLEILFWPLTVPFWILGWVAGG